MEATAVVFEKPKEISLAGIEMIPVEDNDVLVDTYWSGISTGTEKMFWDGSMPPFPGMGYPLVPGYEAVGRVKAAGKNAEGKIGDLVFIPGARCFKGVSSLFGASASNLIVSNERAMSVPETLGNQAVLLALAATAHHAIAMAPRGEVDLIIGHGVVGRLLARIAIAIGNKPPQVWEIDPRRQEGADGYVVTQFGADSPRDLSSIIDASGSIEAIDIAVSCMAPGATLTLAGFYQDRVSFNFPAAFMREAKLQISAEFKPDDVTAVLALIENGRLSLDGLISHHLPSAQATTAYETAFNDPNCIKMILDWKEPA